MMLTPQENPSLTGHDQTFATLKKAVDTGQLPHSLIINGAQGIGKATFIFHLIRYALGSGDDMNTPTSRKIAAGSHPNVLVVTPTFDEKKQRFKSTLTVDEAHKVVPFFRQTSVDNAWRFVVVDKAHTMNRNAQNAILKILEEPPARSSIFLISENSGAFLPTIRSRCQMMHLSPLSYGDTVAQLITHFGDTLSEDQIQSYARLSQGSLGNAFDLIEMDALTVAEDFEHASLDMVKNHENAVLSFCEEYGNNAKSNEYNFIKQLIAHDLNHVIRAKIANNEGDLSPWQTYLFHNKQEGELVTVHDRVTSVFDAGDVSFLDRKLVLLNALQAMK